MADEPDLAETIASNATNPNSVTADGITVSQNPLSEVIAADKYLQARTARNRPPFGVVIAGIVAPGAQQ